MKRGDVETVHLQPGMVLTVTCDAASTASVVREADSNGGGQPQSPVAVAASSAAEFGPFDHTTRYTISGLSGTGITKAVGAPALATSCRVISASLTPSAVGAASVARQNVTVTGASVLDKVCAVSGNTGNATGVCMARVVAQDTVEVSWINPTAGSLTPGAGTYNFLLAR